MAGKSGPETKLVAKMRKAAVDHYGKRHKTFKHHGGPFAEKGVSDTITCLDGIYVAIEVKAPESYGGSVEKALRDGPTPNQRTFVKNVIEAGGVAGFAATVEQYMAILYCAEQVALAMPPGKCLGHNV